MGWRGTAALAAGLLLALLFAGRDVLLENPDANWEWLMSEVQPTPPSADVEPLLRFARERVTELRIAYGKLKIDTQRTEQGWSEVDNPALVDEYLDSLAASAVIRRLDASDGVANLEQYGLAPPRAVIELAVAEGPPVILRLGDRNPTATGVYCRLGDDGPVILTGALVLWELDKLLRALAPAPPAS